MSADWLEEVEILKHFTNSRLVQGIQQSEEVAINLKLKEDAKSPLFGTVDAGVGTTAKYLFKVEVLSYFKQNKSFAFGEANNTGTDLERFDLDTYNSIELSYKGFILPEPIIKNQLSLPSFLKAERFTFHEGQLLSNTMITRLSYNTSLRSITTVYNNHRNFNFSDSIYYVLPDGNGFSFAQKQKQRQSPFEFFQDIKIENQLSANQDFIVRLQYKQTSDKPVTTSFTGISRYHDELNVQSNQLFSGLSHIYKFDRNWVNTLDIELGTNSWDEAFSLTRRDIKIDSIKQQLEQCYLSIGIFDRLDGIITQNRFINSSSGWSLSNSQIDFVQNHLIDSRYELNDYQFSHLFTELNFEKKINDLRILFGGRLRNAIVQFNGKSSSDDYFEPTVSASIKTEVKHLNVYLKGLYNIEYVFLKPYQLIHDALLVDYRSSLSFNLDPATPVKNQMGFLTIKLTDDNFSSLSANAKWVYLKSSATLISQLMFENDAVKNNQWQGGTSNNFISTYSLDKYFSDIKSTIKLAYDYSFSTTPLDIDGSIDDSESIQNIISITSGHSITSQMNISLAFKRSEIRAIWNGQNNRFNFNNYFVKIVIKPIEKFRLSFDYQAINFNQWDDYSSIVNMSIFFTMFENKLSMSFSGNNLMNKDAIILSEIEPSSFSNAVYPLQNRFALLSVNYRF